MKPITPCIAIGQGKAFTRVSAESKMNISGVSKKSVRIMEPNESCGLKSYRKMLKTNDEECVPMEITKTRSETVMSGLSTKYDSTKRLTTKKYNEAYKLNLCNELSQITT